jgi:hypothetical protein
MIKYFLWYFICGFIIIKKFYTNTTTYKKYTRIIYDFLKKIINNNIEILKKRMCSNSKQITNKTDKIKEIKNIFGIKSSEDTLNLTNLIINKPRDVESIDDIKNTNFRYTKGLIKIANEYIFSKDIIDSYIYSKKMFNNIFTDENSKYKINDLNTFNIFCQNNMNNKNEYNILLKFYSKIGLNEYNYILVKKNNLIKIKHNEDYDKICNCIYIKNKIFLLKNSSNDHFIFNGDYIKQNIDSQQIKKIFFPNKNYDDYNYNMLKKYNYIQIIFFVCVKINL